MTPDLSDKDKSLGSSVNRQLATGEVFVAYCLASFESEGDSLSLESSGRDLLRDCTSKSYLQWALPIFKLISFKTVGGNLLASCAKDVVRCDRLTVE